MRQVTVNAYERNQEAREECLRHHGRSCIICGFNFMEAYGAEAADYIQVHHIKPIARAGGRADADHSDNRMAALQDHRHAGQRADRPLDRRAPV